MKKKKVERPVVFGLEAVGGHLEAQTEKIDVVDTLETAEGENIEFPNEAVVTLADTKKVTDQVIEHVVEKVQEVNTKKATEIEQSEKIQNLPFALVAYEKGYLKGREASEIV